MPIISYTPTPPFTPVLVPPRDIYTNMDLQQVIKLALDSFIQGYAHAQEPAEL